MKYERGTMNERQSFYFIVHRSSFIVFLRLLCVSAVKVLNIIVRRISVEEGFDHARVELFAAVCE
jgi:hypothetical protein